MKLKILEQSLKSAPPVRVASSATNRQEMPAGTTARPSTTLFRRPLSKAATSSVLNSFRVIGQDAASVARGGPVAKAAG